MDNIFRRTILSDIDGTLIKHFPPNEVGKPGHEPVLLEGTLEKLKQWDSKGYIIILISGRKESLRKVTEEQLTKLGIFYDQLILGVGGGTRVLINDFKPDSEVPTALAFCFKRDYGIKDVEI